MKDTRPVNLTGTLKNMERLSTLMDEQFRIPGTEFRFGFDPILNLIPFAGDFAGFIVSAWIVYIIAKHGVSRKVQVLMALNVLLDAVIGAIPLVGQISDFYFKANTRNIKLLKEHYVEGKHQGSGTGIILFLLLLVFILLGLVLFGFYKLIIFVFHQPA